MGIIMRSDKRKVNVVKNKAGNLQGDEEEYKRKSIVSPVCCLHLSPL